MAAEGAVELENRFLQFTGRRRPRPHCEGLSPVKNEKTLNFGKPYQTECFKMILTRCVCVHVHIRPAAVPRMNNAPADIWLRGRAFGSWAACPLLTDGW